MGKTQKPLSILVTVRSMLDWPEIEELRLKGHTVGYLGNVFTEENWDLILGPNCWMMDEQHRLYLKVAVEAARKKRYPK